MSRRAVSLRINGVVHDAQVEPRLSLADFIREVAGLKGTRLGCEHGVCGTCTVQLDGEPVRSCLLFAVQAEGRGVRTVEALTGATGELHPLQEAFHAEHALQCGFCTSGFLTSLDAFIRDGGDGDWARDAVSGNLCRCTGYAPIVAAAERAAQELGPPAEQPPTRAPTSSPTPRAG